MIEILYFDGCPNHDGLETRIRGLCWTGSVTTFQSRRGASPPTPRRKRNTSSARRPSASMASTSIRTPRHVTPTDSCAGSIAPTRVHKDRLPTPGYPRRCTPPA